jgi:hypothetical protein
MQLQTETTGVMMAYQGGSSTRSESRSKGRGARCSSAGKTLAALSHLLGKTTWVEGTSL